MENWGLRQEIALSTGTSYKVTFTAKQLTGVGEMYSGLGYTAVPFFNQVITSSFVTYTYYQSPTNVTAPYDTVYFGGKLATGAEVENTFEIKDVLVEPLGVDWTLGTGWSIGEDKAVAVAGTTSKLVQPISGLSGKSCKVTFTLSEYGGSGSVIVDFGSTSSSSINTNDTHTVYGTYDINNFELLKGSPFSGSITNISVQELDSPQIKIGSGALTLPKLGQGDNTQTITDSASIEFYFLRGGGDVDYNADITDVTVRETGMGWVTYGSQVNFYNGYTELVIDSSNTNVGIYQENVFQSGVKYRVDVTMKATAPFDAEIVESNAASTITSIGTPSLTTEYQDFTYYFTGTGSYDLFIHRLSTASSANQTIYIKSASVRQMSDDTITVNALF
jgi:hypothetical protein